MKLEDLGYNSELESHRLGQGLDGFEVGRISSEHRERYRVLTPEGEYEGEIIGNLRFSASKRADFPAVGDWVAISEYDQDKVLIHAIFPRNSVIERQAVGKQGEKQIIATNIDTAFIVQAVDRDFNINRLERYLSICQAAGVEALILLNKIDLIADDEFERMRTEVEERIPGTDLLCISNESRQGLDELQKRIAKGKTYCLLGSSGVGKSTLSNVLNAEPGMATGEISTSTGKGKHVTSHRQMFLMDGGGLLIDNPGMREVGMTDQEGGLEATFDGITELSASCRYLDCTHTSESGCAVLEALEQGDLDESVYENYQKLQREKEHFEASVAEKRRKDKDFGKMVREVKKIKKRNLE